MADNILSRYGMGYVDPRLTSDSEDATTYNVLASMPEKYRVPAVESDPKKWGSTGDVMAHLDRNVLHRYGADMPAMIGDFVDAAHEIGSAPLATPHYVDPALTRQMMEHAASVVGPQAGVALGRGMMTHAPAGTTDVGMFAGRNARTADHAKLAAAEWAESRGASREAIHTETGWFRGVDGKWRFEIPDNAAKIHAERGQFGDAFSHPELFDAYPDLANARLAMDAASGGQYEPRGARPETISIGEDHYRRYPGTIPPESVALHEAQHGIQGREGFATGANGADAHYLNSAGETEARAVQARRNLTPEQRASRPPWLDYDVPEGQQIVRFGERGPQMSTEGLPATRAVVLNNYTTPSGKGGERAIVLRNTNQLRSINAAFDPARAHEPNLLASDGIGPQGVNARRADDPHAKFDQTLSGILKTYGLR